AIFHTGSSSRFSGCTAQASNSLPVAGFPRRNRLLSPPMLRTLNNHTLQSVEVWTNERASVAKAERACYMTRVTGSHKVAENFNCAARTLQRSYFVSQEVFEKEQERVFSRQWLCVGHQSQIARAGDYFAQSLPGESLILLRDQSSQVRG